MLAYTIYLVEKKLKPFNLQKEEVGLKVMHVYWIRNPKITGTNTPPSSEIEQLVSGTTPFVGQTLNNI